MGSGFLATTAVAPPVDVPIESQTILDVIRGWKQGWFWHTFRIVGDVDWVISAIENDPLLTLADGSYIHELLADACSCAFVFDCQDGGGRILGKMVEGSKDACACRGELLGLLAIHLILLAANKRKPDLTGRVRIISDCLGALGRVVSLPGDRLPSGTKHSDIQNILMVHFQSFSFECIYEHVEAQQDEEKAYHGLPREAQLNSCMNLEAKSELGSLVGQEVPAPQPLPWESIVVRIGKDKMTAGLEESIVYWCNKAFAWRTLSDSKVKWLDEEQFDEVYWPACYSALTGTKRIFQIFACKQTMGIAGCNKNQYYTPGHDKKCPSCRVEIETGHVLSCNEAGPVEVLHKSIDLLDWWLKDNVTETNLRRFLMQEIVGFQLQYRRLAISVDCIGWRRLMEGMISCKLVELQKYALVEAHSRMTVDAWAKELVIKLLEITHGQWLYCNVMVHIRTAGDLVTRRKEEIREALEEQMELGEEGLAEEDRFLLEINLDELDNSTGEEQTYWLLSLQAAREARQLLSQQNNGAARGN